MTRTNSRFCRRTRMCFGVVFACMASTSAIADQSGCQSPGPPDYPARLTSQADVARWSRSLEAYNEASIEYLKCVRDFLAANDSQLSRSYKDELSKNRDAAIVEM